MLIDDGDIDDMMMSRRGKRSDCDPTKQNGITQCDLIGMFILNVFMFY